MSYGLSKGMGFAIFIHILCLALLGNFAPWPCFVPNNEKIYEVFLLEGSSNRIRTETLTSVDNNKIVKEGSQPLAKLHKKSFEEEKAMSHNEVVPSIHDVISEGKATEKKADSKSLGNSSGDKDGIDNESDNAEIKADKGSAFDINAIQSDVSPFFLGGATPIYPPAAQSRKLGGTVQVQMVVSKDGSVESASIIGSSGIPSLDRAALDAVYTYRFSPAYKAGYPVRCYFTRNIVFR